MARMLGRSKSFRLLRGGHKETRQREEGDTTPQPTLPTVEADRLKAATPVTRAENIVETPDPEMLQRPGTSGGSGDRSTLFHRKVAPAQYPDDPRFDVTYVSPTKSTTTLYTTQQISEGEGIIGIALGSPTMAPQNWDVFQSTDFVTQNQGTITQISSNSLPSEASRPVAVIDEAPKPKISRWKSIFKKTAPPPRQNKDAFYQLAKTVNPARVDSHHDTESVGSRSLAQEEATGTKQSPTYSFKSDIRPSRNKKGQMPATDTRPRALTAGSASSGQSKAPLSRFALSPRPQIPTQSSIHLPSVTASGGTQDTSPSNGGGKPLLDVDIPQVHMERYSVMFSGVLPPSTTNSSSSLLQRRQGNTDKVKPLNGLSIKVRTKPSD